MNSTERHAAVESLAHHLWIARGKPIGSPEIDWLEAERRYEEGGSDISDNEPTVVASSLSKSAAASDGAFPEEGGSRSRRVANSVLPDGEDTDFNSAPRSSNESDDANAERTKDTLRLPKSSRKR